jgi:hypothetical protein
MAADLLRDRQRPVPSGDEGWVLTSASMPSEHVENRLNARAAMKIH